MIKSGIYQHYKGNQYRVLHVAKHSETEELLVIYQPLYGDQKMQNSIWARPLTMFTENISVNGKTMPRFALISED